MTDLVRAACLTHYAELASSHGLDPRAMLRDAGLNPACLRNPDLKVSAVAVSRLLEESAAQSGQDAFGLLMAQERRVSNLGVAGLLTREEPTLRLALESFMRFGRLHNESLVMRVEESGGLAMIREDMLVGWGVPVRQATELAVGVLLRLLRVFLGPDWQPRRVCFTHPEPASLAVHRRVLGITPEFGHEFNGVVCRSADLDAAISTADPVVAEHLRRELSEAARQQATLSAEVRQMVFILLPAGRATVEQVAQTLGVTRRTLHRRLAGEGASFSALLQSVRGELAQRYVRHDQRPLTQVSQLLGFATPAAFSRWHRQAFGESARVLRRH